MTNIEYDICVVGSGAGAGPVIYELAKAGFKVLVLEKGPWLKTEDYTKDEFLACRKDVYTPNLANEFHDIESYNKKKKTWISKTTFDSGNTYWNGNVVGGSSNFMTAYFHRLKPVDFKLKSTYGDIAGANIADWPISYEDLESYYAKVESVIGVSGEIRAHSTQEPRSTKDFPFPPLKTNVVANWLDQAAEKEGYNMVSVARGIISKSKDDRKACYYSNYCGSYGCASNAKSSSRVALLNQAIATGNCEIIPNAKVYELVTNGANEIRAAKYYKNKVPKEVTAKLFVVAAQAIETARLLLQSKTKEYPNGIGNNTGQVGKNLVFSAGGIGSGNLFYDDFSDQEVDKINSPGLWVNRAIQNWYEIEDDNFGGKIKGGTVDFIFEHSNPMPRINKQKWSSTGDLVYGSALKTKIQDYFIKQRKIKFEIFNDWLPTDDCYVSLSETEKDQWGDPVAKVRIGYHPHDLKVAKFLATKAETLLNRIGAKNVKTGISGKPSPNLVAGGCRFGHDKKTSVLDSNCKVHDCANLFITDASFMPTGGSVPYTWTIYANAFRVADHILNLLTKS